MLRSGAAVAVCGLAMLGIVSAIAAPQTRGRDRVVPPQVVRGINDALTAYEGGDDLAVERLFAASIGPSTPYLDTVLAQPAPWSRARAAFLLEVAIQQRFGPGNLLTAGRLMITARPARLGADAREDRFEVLWHQAAIGLLQSQPSVAAQVEYLQGIETRFADATRLGVALETRFPLARAIVASIVCCWKPTAGEIVRQIPSHSRDGVTLDGALKLLDDTAALLPLRAEAYVRGGKLLFDAGRLDEALAWLSRVPDHDDRAIGKVQHLVRGRAFDRLNRPADAAEAYAKALELVPAFQPAAIGLSAALLRAGRPDAALTAAADARRIPARSPSFGAEFADLNRGDLRFVPAWLSEIRSLRR
jgi:hypothetical protein